MPVLPPVWCGIAVHAAPLTACRRRVSDEGQITPALVECGTPSRALLAFRPWLQAQQWPVGAMESPGVSWQPVSQVLSEAVEVGVAHSHAVRQRPGKTTAKRDAPWIAALLAPGVITPRCVPPPAMRALRALTRPRGVLGQTRTHAKNRVDKMLAHVTTN